MTNVLTLSRKNELSLRLIASSRRIIGADRSVFEAGDKAEHVYRVASGCVRLVHLRSDGRGETLRIACAGEYLALSDSETHALSAVADVPSEVDVITRKRLGLLAEGAPAISAWLRDQSEPVVALEKADRGLMPHRRSA